MPLIVRGPGVPAGSSCHENVIGYDLFPTFCVLAGGAEVVLQQRITARHVAEVALSA